MYLFRTDFVFLCNIFQLPQKHIKNQCQTLREDNLNQILLDLLLLLFCAILKKFKFKEKLSVFNAYVA